LKRFFALSAALLLSAACAPSLPQGQIEPIRKVLSDNRSLPYECVNYDAKSDSCEGLITRRLQGDRIFYEATAVMPGPSDILNTRMKVDFTIENGRYCGNMRTADLHFEGTLTTSQRSFLQELMLAQLISFGDVCGVYYRNGGAYVSVTTDREGRVMPEGVDTIHFFATPKRLRL
jgi:hypothetical protein